MDDSLANDLAYLEGKISVALRRDADKKLKCKQGYVQRGSACQKIEGKKGGNLARNIGVGLGTAALVGGVAAIAASPKESESDLMPRSVSLTSALPEGIDTKKQVKAFATISGATLAGYLGIKAGQKAGITTGIESSVYKTLSENKLALDELVDKSALTKKQKDLTKGLLGGVKRELAFRLAAKSGAEIIEVDKENNSFTFKGEEGSFHTIGSYGSTILGFNTLNKGAKNGAAIYEMNFTTNDSFNRGTEMDIATARKVIEAANTMFEKHSKLLPDECIVRCEANKEDGKGKARKNIYQKKGFTSLGHDPYLYILKTGGQIKPIVKESWKKHVRKLLTQKMSFGVARNNDSLLTKKRSTQEG